MKNFGLLSLVALAGSSVTAFAQDSVSSGAGLPGDALEAGITTPGYQRSAYVVDMTRLFGSWGTRLGVAPIVKTSSYVNNFRSSGNPVFNALGSAQGLSQTLNLDAQTPVSSYRLWENLPGAGAHPVRNSGGTTVSPFGATSQFAAGVSEFAFDDTSRSYNGIIGAMVNFDPAAPDRLYVVRTQAAINVPTTGGDRSQFGLGAVDVRGNIAFRADAFGSTGSPTLTGNNYFRVRTNAYGAFAGRNAAALNLIDNTGGSDAAATDWVVVRSATTHNTPNTVPADRSTDPRGAVIGSNFGTNYVYENAPLAPAATTAHRPGTADHRGGVAYSALRLRPGNTVGTGAMITKTFSGNGQPSENISVWGVSGNGLPVNAVTVNLPRGVGATLTDPCGSLPMVPYNWDLGTGDFRHYSGSTFARGGNGQVAMAIDQGGNGLLAAEVSGAQSLSGGLPTNDSPHNAIAVYRFNLAQPSAGQWIAAAWTNPAGAFSDSAGKEIYGDYGNDGAPFTNDPGEFDDALDLNPLSPTFDGPIGQMTSLFEVSGALIGPSHSAPAFDSVGNIYFISAVRLKKANGFIDTDSALLRAVYDRANFCYRLELIMELGDTFAGRNSGVRYQVQFLNTSTGTNPSPSSMWSNNGASYAWNGIDPTSIDSKDPKALGGLVLNASIVYDIDQDGDYENAATNPGSLDEQYQVLLYVGNMDPEEAPGCPADFNGDGFLDFFDYDDFVACFEGSGAPGCNADFNGDAFVDFFDYDDFVLAFETGC